MTTLLRCSVSTYKVLGKSMSHADKGMSHGTVKYVPEGERPNNGTWRDRTEVVGNEGRGFND